MVTLHEVITFLVSMQISISSLQTHNVNRCGRSRHLARKLSLRSEERFSRNAETDLVCRLLLEKKKKWPGSQCPCISVRIVWLMRSLGECSRMRTVRVVALR